MVISDQLDGLLRISDVAEMLHAHPNTLRRWSEQGKIGAYRVGSRGDRRFPQSEVTRFVAERNPLRQNEYQLPRKSRN